METAETAVLTPLTGMTIILLIRQNNAKKRGLLILVPADIVWINLVLITKLMVNVYQKIVRQILLLPVQVVLSERRHAVVIAKNAVMILVLPVILNQRRQNVMIQKQQNAEQLAIKKNLVMFVPDILIVGVLGNIAKEVCAHQIVQNVVFIVRAIISRIAVLHPLFVLLMAGFTETVIAQNHAEHPVLRSLLSLSVRIRGVMLMLIAPVHIVIVMPDIQGAELPAVQIFVMGLRARRQIWNVSTSLMVIANVAVDGEIIQAVNVRKIMARSGFVALRKNEPGMEIMLLNVWQTVILAKQTVFILNVRLKAEHLVVQVVILMVVDIMFAHIDVLFRQSIFLFDILLNIYIKKKPRFDGAFC